MNGDSSPRLTRALAAAALGLAVLAALAGSPYSSHHAAIDVASLARTVAREEDHVTARGLERTLGGADSGEDDDACPRGPATRMLMADAASTCAAIASDPLFAAI